MVASFTVMSAAVVTVVGVAVRQYAFGAEVKRTGPAGVPPVPPVADPPAPVVPPAWLPPEPTAPPRPPAPVVPPALPAIPVVPAVPVVTTLPPVPALLPPPPVVPASPDVPVVPALPEVPASPACPLPAVPVAPAVPVPPPVVAGPPAPHAARTEARERLASRASGLFINLPSRPSVRDAQCTPFLNIPDPRGLDHRTRLRPFFSGQLGLKTRKHPGMLDPAVRSR